MLLDGCDGLLDRAGDAEAGMGEGDTVERRFLNHREADQEG